MLLKTDTKANANRFVYLATAVAALGGMLFGYDVGVISGAILFVKKDFSLSPGLEEVVISSVLLGSLIGAIAGGVLADRWGRRRLLIITASVFGIGAIGAALSPDTGWLIVARILALPSGSLLLSPRFTYQKSRQWLSAESSFRLTKSP